MGEVIVPGRLCAGKGIRVMPVVGQGGRYPTDKASCTGTVEQGRAVRAWGIPDKDSLDGDPRRNSGAMAGLDSASIV